MAKKPRSRNVNGEGGASFMITLNTGYEVVIRQDSILKDLEHLTRALMGENFMVPAGELGDWKAAFPALRDGIRHVVVHLPLGAVEAMLDSLLFKAVTDECGRLGEREKVKNPKGKAIGRKVRTSFPNDLVRGLVSRLERIAEKNEMTEKDADELLACALSMNLKFVELTGVLEAPGDVVKAVRMRCAQVLDEVAV